MPERKKAGRRSNHEGCIRQRPNGLWEAQYIASYKPDGRPVRRSIYGKKKAEVRMKLRDILLSIERDEYMDVRTLSEILGHTKVALTLQLYAHSSMETKQKEVAKMDAFL